MRKSHISYSIVFERYDNGAVVCAQNLGFGGPRTIGWALSEPVDVHLCQGRACSSVDTRDTMSALSEEASLTSEPSVRYCARKMEVTLVAIRSE